MALRIVLNETHHSTREIRRVLARCLREVRKTETDKRSRYVISNLRVRVRYSRYGYYAGSASLSAPRMTLRLPRNGQFSAYSLAELFLHELGHNLGKKGHRKGLTIEHLYRDFIRRYFGEYGK